jgi:arabinosaccharide transport system substrate-binding protein
VGLLPLNDFIARSRWGPQLLESRLAPWTKQGTVFGIPHDVHPVSITYRKDLWDQAGIDPTQAATWREFHEMCLAFNAYWRSQGHPNRFAIELSATGSDNLMMMLMQRHINPLDTHNKSHLTDPRVAETIVFLSQMVAGRRAVSATPNPGPNVWARDFSNGYLCALVTPDWRAGYLPTFAPEVAGKVAMMPLPRFETTDAPTATWGGTMIGIPRGSRNHQAAWKAIEHLYFSQMGLKARQEVAMILPPTRDAWTDPIWHQPDPYFGGQKVGELYIALAEQLPRREVTPFTIVAQQLLTVVLSRAVADVNAGRLEGLESRVAGWLSEADQDLRRRIEFNTFE